MNPSDGRASARRRKPSIASIASSRGVLGSSMARAADHFAGKDAPEGDAVELWGRRIGRSLSLIGVIVLGYLLGVQLKLW